MLIAVISDIHANWPALEAVLADLGPVDEVICLGDVVGYGGDPVRCVDYVRDQGWLTLTGNHDRACADTNCERQDEKTRLTRRGAVQRAEGNGQKRDQRHQC